MRISSNQIFQQGVTALLDQQSALMKTQLQISSGKRILSPADDPAGSAQAVELTRVIETTRQYQKNADAAQARLGLAEHTLSAVNDLLQRVRELTVQGNNDSQTAESRLHIAQEVRERLKQLLGLANTKDANNEYLFAGYQGLTTPFTASGAGGYSYNGDQGQRFLEVGPGQRIAVSDSGTEIFQRIRNGNGIYTTLENPANAGTAVIVPQGVSSTFVADVYTLAFAQATPASPVTYTVTGAASGVVASGTYAENATIAFNGAQVSFSGTPADGDSFTVRPAQSQDVFETLDNLASALEAGGGGGAALAHFHNAMNRALSDLDQSLGNVLEARAVLGARQHAVDSQVDANEAFGVQLNASLSQVQDLDYAEAASRLNQQLAALEAAQLAFVKVQGLSLFDFL